MKITRCILMILAICLGLFPLTLKSQEIDLLLKGGKVIDEKNGINELLDVAISSGKIVQVAANIPEDNAKSVVDVSGLYVVPGIINIHTHVFAGGKRGFADGSSSQQPDAFAIRSGTTTVVDAGTSGWENFPLFKSQVIDPSITRVLAFLNIYSMGFSSGAAIEPDMKDLDVEKTVEAIRQYPDIIVGTRIGHYSGSSWEPFDRAAQAAREADVPLFVECHLPQYSLADQLNRMRRGDIITHAFENVSERMPVVDERGQLRPLAMEAMQRGILFDVGHGGAGFWFNQAIPAMQQGLLPNSFGTDEHRNSMISGMKDILNVMSKYLAMGMELEDVIARATWLPAQSIKRPDLGHLSVGAVADIAVLGIRNGNFGFVDSGKNKISGTQKLEAEMTIREGRIVWDLNGLSAVTYEPLATY